MRPPSSTLPLTYKLLSLALLPVFTAHTLWRGWRDGGWSFVAQRFGFSHTLKSPHLWFHAASVGEVNTLIPLLEEISKHNPKQSLLVSTTTPTGKAALQRAPIKGVQHSYLPLDYRFAIKRFISRCQPTAAFIVETEIWPCLYRSCEIEGIPLLIINGRISDKTMRVRYTVLGPSFAQALRRVSGILARSEKDAELFRLLSQNAVSKQHKSNDHELLTRPLNTSSGQPTIRITGNLKHAFSAQPSNGPALLNRPYCLLASTHADEELQLSKAWLTHNRPELLVIVPRHPERIEKLLAQLQTVSNSIRVRSKQQHPDSNTRLYLADTLGELTAFYQHAAVVFVGGSLSGVGGHNVLEPARSGCAIVVGPDMHNFEEELSELKARNGIMQCSNATEAIETLCHLLDNKKDNQRLGKNALAVTDSHRDMAKHYLQALETYL